MTNFASRTGSFLATFTAAACALVGWSAEARADGPAARAAVNPIVAVRQAAAHGQGSPVVAARTIGRTANGGTVVLAVRGEGFYTTTVSAAGKVGPWSNDLRFGRGGATQRTALFVARGGAKNDSLKPDRGFLVASGVVRPREANDPLWFRGLSNSGKSIRVAAYDGENSRGQTHYFLTRVNSDGTLGKTTMETKRPPAPRPSDKF